MNKKVKVLAITSVILFILCVLAIGYLFFIDNEEEHIEEGNFVIEEIEENISDDQLLWEENKKINNDYVGNVRFKSGLIDLPFVCPSKDIDEYKFYVSGAKIVNDYDNDCESGPCSLNDVYLRTDWKTMEYELGGSVFMDYRNSLDDQNIIIYGHHYPESMDKERAKFFTPLESLRLKDNYEDNKYVDLILNNEIRHYEIVYVYDFNVESEDDYNNLQYFRTEYEYDYYMNEDIGYYQKYIDNIEKVKKYDSGIKLTTNDSTLTLQTCLDIPGNYVEIVVAREINY